MTPAPSEFTFEPLFLALTVVAAVLYARAARRNPPGRRALLFAAGLLLVAGALNSPLETIAVHYLVLFHLLQNVMIADWAPPLLILGLTPRMRADIVRFGGHVLGWLAQPKVALPVWLVGWYGIHLALFYDFALENAWALNLEHALLIGMGLLFWWPVLAPEQRRLGPAVSIGYLGAAFILSAFLGLALTFSPTPFYDHYVEAPRLWGFSAAEDQNLGGVLMTAEQSFVFLVAIGYFVLGLVREDEQATT